MEGVGGIGQALGGLAGAGSIAGGLWNMFGGGGNANASNVQLPGMQSVNIGGITPHIDSGIQGLGQYNIGGQNAGQYQGILQNTINNPFSGQNMQGAQQFGQAGMGNALSGLYNANQIGGGIPSLMQGGNAVMQAGFDPQNALYDRTRQQSQDQNLAMLVNSGIAGTPWGQGVAANANNNFNIDWQNQQLQRMISGGGAANNMFQGAGQLGAGAFGLGSTAANAGAQMAGLPYGTYNQMGGNALSLLGGGAQYGSNVTNTANTAVGDWLSYLGGGNQANQVANQTAQVGLNQADLANRQQMGWGNMIGSGLSSLGRMFGGGGGSSGGSGYA